MWVLVKYEGKKFIETVQREVKGQYNMRCLEKPLGTNIPQRKEQDEHSIFCKNFYGTDIKPRLTDINENGKNTCQWLWTY